MADSNEASTGSSDEDEPLVKLQHAIRLPIVYTTKLDDMKIFKQDTAGMDADTIINSIIKESKPTLKRKRKCTQARNAHSSKEDLSSHINTFHRKFARTAEDIKIAICKPVKVVLVDIKHTLLRTHSNESRNSETVKTTQPLVSDDKPQKRAYRLSHKLKSRLIYDQQLKEADMYSLDKHLLVKEHNKLRIDSSNEFIFKTLEYDKNVLKDSCCCWYSREQFLSSTMLGFIPHETLRFMRKPHKCEFNRCSCCCRNKSINEYVWNDISAQKPSTLEASESPRIWLNKMSVMHASQLLSNKTRNLLLSKSLSVKPSETKINPMKSAVKLESSYFLHSTNIDFGTEYYEIGSDGHIKLSLKNIGKDRQELANLQSKTADNIVGDICCWFKREEFAARLLVLGALPNAVNYIRSTHPCSPSHCRCCCKPSNTVKPQLIPIHKAARHTNDLVSKKINIKVRFAEVAEKAVSPISVRAPKATIPKNINDIVSFNVSLSALQNISEGIVTVDSILKDVIDLPHDKKKSSVRVLLRKEETAKNKTVVIECNTHINDFTTSELKLLDIIFRAVNKTREQTVAAPVHRKINRTIRTSQAKNISSHIYNAKYPLLLNKHLSITTDLRSKRFMPPLRAHLEQYDWPEMVSNINLWMAEAKQQSVNKM